MTYPKEIPADGATNTETPPRVQYAWYQAGQGKRVPLWAFSIAELNKAERERAELIGLLWPPEAEIHGLVRARFSRFREELNEQIKAKELAAICKEPAREKLADTRVPPKLEARGAGLAAPEKPQPTHTLMRPHSLTEAERQQLKAAATELAEMLAEMAQSGGCTTPAKTSTSTCQEPQEAPCPPPPITDLHPAGGTARPRPPMISDNNNNKMVLPAQPVAATDSPKEPPAIEADIGKPAAPQFPIFKPRRTGLVDKLKRSPVFKTSHRSRRTCPACGGETRYVASLISLLSRRHRRICKSCAYREPPTKIYKLDSGGL